MAQRDDRVASGEDQPSPRAVAIEAIQAALHAQHEEAEAIERWRAFQVDTAIVAFLNGRYGDAMALAAKSQLQAAEIPVDELGRPLRETLEQLRQRVKALQDYFNA